MWQSGITYEIPIGCMLLLLLELQYFYVICRNKLWQIHSQKATEDVLYLVVQLSM